MENEDKAVTDNSYVSIIGDNSPTLKTEQIPGDYTEKLEEENVDKDNQSNHINSHHQWVKKDEDGLDNTNSQNKQNDSKINNTENEAKTKDDIRLNDTVKEDDRPFNYIVNTDCKAEYPIHETFKCNKFKGFYISIKRFWFIRKKMVIDAEKAINEQAIRYYLGDLDKPQFVWEKDTCTLYIYSSGSHIMSIVVALIMAILSF